MPGLFLFLFFFFERGLANLHPPFFPQHKSTTRARGLRRSSTPQSVPTSTTCATSSRYLSLSIPTT
jgi:hypothetical protein